ncbi:hypothetical protein LZF95_24200 [Algoriphagus sp. AGSA1]|uniref:hypothetical protein n=1 Tax=Algoriphagus sp. AGSA1 TaxID=2907213 RepID=UPI001F2FFD03|nr:hypothetical protein [Algoriphagus sp. AGSA1]MCE7057807.1 hypothetical protein [Algoriphagus sp. AGSA1]
MAFQNELDVIEEIITSFPNGLAIDELIEKLPFSIKKGRCRDGLKTLKKVVLSALKERGSSYAVFCYPYALKDRES